MTKYTYSQRMAIVKAKASLSYYCSKCHRYHRRSTKIGKAHKTG